jgi:hypothetical protein
MVLVASLEPHDLASTGFREDLGGATPENSWKLSPVQPFKYGSPVFKRLSVIKPLG